MTTTSLPSVQTKFNVDPSVSPGIDPQRVAAAQEVLNHGTSKVYKSTRSGLTTSAVIAATTSGKKVLIVEPTNRILDETISDASQGNLVQVLSNRFCLKLEESIKHDPFLAKLPVPLPNCQECESFRSCPVTEILESNKPAITITYHKLEALMLSKSITAREIREKLSRVDTIILDEAHTLALPNVVSIPAFSEVDIPEGYSTLSEIQQKWLELNGEQHLEIQQIADTGSDGHVGKHLSEIFPNNDPSSFRKTIVAFNELHDLAISRKELGIQDKDILLLRDMIQLMSSDWLNITYIKESGSKEGRVYLTGNYWVARSALRSFLSEYAHRADHFYVSGTLVEPYPDFFSELSGKHVNDVMFPDLKDTNSKMTVCPDTWRLSAQNFTKNLPRIIDRIVEICNKHPNERVFVVAPNARMATAIQRCLIEIMGDASPLINYYRSDETMGVENSARICIAVGLAELPSNTYDHLARGRDKEEKWIESQRLRQESVDAASWQTWSRVKDPEGKKESIVYSIGVREARIRSVLSWGSGRRLDLLRVKSYKLPDGTAGRVPIFKTIVREPSQPPMIASETAVATGGRAQGNIGEGGQKREKYDPTLIIYEFGPNLPIIYNRQNLDKLGIYNNPQDEFESSSSTAILTSLFAARFDCWATQNKSPDASGRYGYSKSLGNPKMMLGMMKHHIRGHVTVGFYQIGLDDKVKWICFDIDDHEDERSDEAVKTDVRKLLAVLSKHNIPFWLEASGSPNSYHVWILLKPAKTSNAFVFIREIRDEAGIECEVFPKQKGLNKDSKYGNLVKVPLGINRKTSVRSQFLDPNTFEPYQGIVPIPDLVCLQEVEEPEETAEKSTKTRIVRRNQENSIRTPMRLGEGMRPCMQAVLHSKAPLEGPEGHAMRVAIASEAYNCGLTEDEAIELFKDLPDFNVEVTRKQIKYIYSKGYYSYSCNKLRDECSSFVRQYCNECSWSND
jgi:hypothetical protein